MLKLPPISNDYEQNILDEYTEYYFILKEKQNTDYYYYYHNHKMIDKLLYSLNYLSSICFNKRDRIIPPYFINKITKNKKCFSIIEKQYTKYIQSIIAKQIDCHLMDTKNIANIIYNYGCKELMYNYYKYGIGSNKRCIIITHIIDNPILLDYYVPYDNKETRDYEEYKKDESKKIYLWKYKKPEIYKIDEIIFNNTNDKITFNTVDNKEYNCIDLYSKMVETENYKYKCSITEKIIKDVFSSYLSCNFQGDLYKSKEHAIKQYIYYKYIL